MNIQILKLLNNEEVLADIEEDDTHFILNNPVGVAIVRGAGGTPSVGFAPFPLHSEHKKDFQMSIAKKHVLYYYTPAEDFINNYNQVFGSGIVLPSKQLVTG